VRPFLKPSAPALSYTQWEAWLALYHGKPLIIAVPNKGAQRDKGFQSTKDQCAAQRRHLARLATLERYPEIRFDTVDRLAVDVVRSKLLEIVNQAERLLRPTDVSNRGIQKLGLPIICTDIPTPGGSRPRQLIVRESSQCLLMDHGTLTAAHHALKLGLWKSDPFALSAVI
jgi:hypothetical protein